MLNKLFLFILLITISCTEQKPKVVVHGNFPIKSILDKINRPIDSTTNYFPYNIFHQPNESNETRHLNTMFSWFYSYYLYNLNEPILSVKYLGNKMYRYFSFEPDKKSIRLIKNDDNVEVVIKYFDVNFDLSVNNQKPFIPRIYKISIAYWDSLTQIINMSKFWDAQNIESDDFPMNTLIEGHSEYGYRIWGPANISSKYNLIYVNRLKKFFERVEKIANKNLVK